MRQGRFSPDSGPKGSATSPGVLGRVKVHVEAACAPGGLDAGSVSQANHACLKMKTPSCSLVSYNNAEMVMPFVVL
jgi:hypothetical protein